MMGPETRLKLFVEVIIGKVGVNLRCKSFFLGFLKESQVENRTKIIEVIWVQTRFLGNESNCSRF